MDLLLHGLRRGDREAFARYFELYRTPVHDLVWRLLRGGEDAVSATEEVFTRVYRRILLHDGPLDLSAWTYGAAIDVCRERLDEREADHHATGGPDADASGSNDLGRRFGQALGMVAFRYQAALLLHDVNGLRPADLANVFGLTEDAAGALLFRAREEFRRAFEEVSYQRSGASCRLAEQAAAGAVGRGLSDDEARRLDAHAGYCRQCRESMKGWGGGRVTLALFLERAPLPEALATTPVFGTALAIDGASSVHSGAGTLAVMLARVGRSLTSRAAAYAVAAVCLAAAVGFAVQKSPVDRVFIPLPATVPSGPTNVRPDASIARPSAAYGGQAVATSIRSLTGSETSVEGYFGATETTATVVAELARSPGDGRLAVGRSATVSGGGDLDATRQDATESEVEIDAKTSKSAHDAAGRGHVGEGNGDRADAARTYRGNSATHAKDGGNRRATKATKDDDGKRPKPAKPARDH